MHQKPFPRKWRSVVESSKEAWCQSERPGRFILTDRRNMAFRLMPLGYWTSSVTFFLLWISVIYRRFFFYYYFEEDVCDLWTNTPPDRNRTLVHCQLFSSAENNLVVAGTSQLLIYKFYTQDEVKTGSVNRLMGTSVVVLLKISCSIIRCRQIHCYLKAKFPRQLNYFRRLFFLVVNGVLRLSCWYPQNVTLFKWSNQNMYIKFQKKMIRGKQTIWRLRGWRRELTIVDKWNGCFLTLYLYALVSIPWVSTFCLTI